MGRGTVAAICVVLAAAAGPVNAAAQLSAEDALCAIGHLMERTVRTETQRINYVRAWVHINSVHGTLTDYSWNIPKVASMLWLTHTEGADYPVLNCGPRAWVMRSILDHLGIDNRVVLVYSDVGNMMQSHTFLEVFNRDTQAWEIQDPDFNVKYEDRTGRALATVDLLTKDLKRDVIPVGGRGRGWRENLIDGLRKYYFELAVYAPRDENFGQYLVLYNPARFNVHKYYPVDRTTFAQYIRTRYYGAPTWEIRPDALVRLNLNAP